MRIDSKVGTYLAAASLAVETGQDLQDYVTGVCPECGEEADELNYEDPHGITVDSDGNAVIILGCEGYWVINPALLGIEKPNWQDWTN